MGLTTGEPTHWTCPACHNLVPYGYAHVCPAVTSQEEQVPIYPTHLSFQELNGKLDKILSDLEKIKEKTDKIK